MPIRAKPAPLPRLAPPAVGDRVATNFDGSLRFGKVKEIRMIGSKDRFIVAFEDDPRKVFPMDESEIWKVRHADTP